jgi:hypothetical protein
VLEGKSGTACLLSQKWYASISSRCCGVSAVHQHIPLVVSTENTLPYGMCCLAAELRGGCSSSAHSPGLVLAVTRTALVFHDSSLMTSFQASCSRGETVVWLWPCSQTPLGLALQSLICRLNLQCSPVLNMGLLLQGVCAHGCDQVVCFLFLPMTEPVPHSSTSACHEVGTSA